MSAATSQPFAIQGHAGFGPRTVVIAEAGVNHNGSLDLARRLIDVAADAGADIVKFQTFRPTKLASKQVRRAAYQERNVGSTESQLEMLERLVLQERDYAVLLEHCRARNVEFLSTPFDVESLHFLMESCAMLRIKIPSGELTNGPFLLEIARAARRRKCALILSTGMSTLAEVEAALGVLAFGLLGNEDPSLGAFEAAFISEEGRAALQQVTTLLHCTTEYPAPVETVHLRAMETLARAFDLPVGFSDHTAGISVPLAAVALGAKVVEKHFTLDRNLPGPDHKASLEPSELAAMVRGIREVEAALGSSRKVPSGPEVHTREVARRVLVAAQPIAKGETLTLGNLTAKRASGGLSPMRLWELLGQQASRAFETDEPIV
jgi:N-acetylneuraminate synthase